jgi:tRNA A37 threonylcarbamoyladenosine dehydratase
MSVISIQESPLSQSYHSLFGGNIRLYGANHIDFIRESHIVVIGLGGVGSWIAEALCRSGVGIMTLIDGDKICESNTNRQIHALHDNYGKPKVRVLSERIRRINPEVMLHPIEKFITPSTLHLLPENPDYVIDAIDSIKDKAAVINHCSRNKVPIICSGGAAGQFDPTAVAIKDLNRTINDPLLAKVRSYLRRYYGFSKNPKRRFGVRCVYSTEQITYPQPDGSACHQKARDRGSLLCDSGLGASVCVTATFGMVTASFVLRKIIDKGLRLQKKKV